MDTRTPSAAAGPHLVLPWRHSSRHRLAFRFALAVTLAVLGPSVVTAHSPTAGEREYSTSGATEEFFLGQGTSGLTWFTTRIETALETNFETANNSLTPNFVRTAVDGVEIKYLLNSQVPDTTECPASFWYACSDYNGGAAKTTWHSTTYNSEDPSGSKVSWWCDHPSQDPPGCFDVGRVLLHEAGHGVGLARSSNGQSHQPDSAAYTTTVMQINPIVSSNTGWNTAVLGTCDLFELSREYDVVDYSDPYPACIDHLSGVAFSGGKIISPTVLNNPPDECTGVSVVLSGTLRLVSVVGASDDDQLGLLAGNGLAGRTISIYRRTPGGSYGSPYTTTTVTSGSSGSWSKSVVSGTSGTWYFQARFAPAGADATTLNSSTSAEFPVTWNPPPC